MVDSKSTVRLETFVIVCLSNRIGTIHHSNQTAVRLELASGIANIINVYVEPRKPIQSLLDPLEDLERGEA